MIVIVTVSNLTRCDACHVQTIWPTWGNILADGKIPSGRDREWCMRHLYLDLWFSTKTGKQWLEDEDEPGRKEKAGKRELDGEDEEEAYGLACAVVLVKRGFSSILLFMTFGPNHTDPAWQTTALSKLDPAMSQSKESRMEQSRNAARRGEQSTPRTSITRGAAESVWYCELVTEDNSETPVTLAALLGCSPEDVIASMSAHMGVKLALASKFQKGTSILVQTELCSRPSGERHREPKRPRWLGESE